jgi:hypothetical protein
MHRINFFFLFYSILLVHLIRFASLQWLKFSTLNLKKIIYSKSANGMAECDLFFPLTLESDS